MSENINNGTELVYYEAELTKKLVSPKVLEIAQKLIPINSTIWAIGSKWGMEQVKVLGLGIGNSGEVEITIQKKNSKAKEVGKLFDLVNCTDF